MRRQFDAAGYLKARKKRTITTALIIAILVPLVMGIVIWTDQTADKTKNMNSVYLALSIVILVGTLVPFFMVFEKRKPKAREIVMVAMMSALTVAGSFATHIVGLGVFQPGTALVMISGISLGPEAGFLVGATARFFVNFFAGQGPWTPWQMVCWGILGFLSGLIFNKVEVDRLKSRSFQVVLGPVIGILVSLLAGYLSFLVFHHEDEQFFGWRLYVFGAVGLIAGLLIQRKRLPVDDVTLALFGFFATFIIYGGIMNIAAMVMASAIPASGVELSWNSLKILYISGVPYDAAHGFATAFFMFLLGDKVIRKVERAKIKYGMYR